MLEWVFELLVWDDRLDELLDVLWTLDILREELALDDSELDGFEVPLSPLPQAVKKSDTTNPEKILFINSIPWCAGWVLSILTMGIVRCSFLRSCKKI